MAGLQYSFFPTDFFYPRPQLGTTTKDTTTTTTQKPVLAIQKKRDSVNDLECLKTLIQNDNINNNGFHGGFKVVKVPSPPLGQNQNASLNS